ncbi:hypothetical protein CHKEEEPN_3239 [Methylorubrum podarium]|nr:hypothetical protein CHKEEEPN_3239 [Methylorubrum podarium]
MDAPVIDAREARRHRPGIEPSRLSRRLRVRRREGLDLLGIRLAVRPRRAGLEGGQKLLRRARREDRRGDHHEDHVAGRVAHPHGEAAGDGLGLVRDLRVAAAHGEAGRHRHRLLEMGRLGEGGGTGSGGELPLEADALGAAGAHAGMVAAGGEQPGDDGGGIGLLGRGRAEKTADRGGATEEHAKRDHGTLSRSRIAPGRTPLFMSCAQSFCKRGVRHGVVIGSSTPVIAMRPILR